MAKRKPRMVYVIMGNDYPDSVFTTEDAAIAYVAVRNLETPQPSSSHGQRRVYWRYYEKELRSLPRIVR